MVRGYRGASDGRIILPMFVAALLLGALLGTLLISSPEPLSSMSVVPGAAPEPDPAPEPEPVPVPPAPEPEPVPVPPAPEPEPVPVPPAPEPEPVPDPIPVTNSEKPPFDAVYRWVGGTGPEGPSEPAPAGLDLPDLSVLPPVDASFLAGSRPAPDLERELQATLSLDSRTARLTLRPGTVVMRGDAASALVSGPSGVLAVQLLRSGSSWVVTTPDLLGALEGLIAELSEGRRLAEAWLVRWPSEDLVCGPPEVEDGFSRGVPGFLLRFAGGSEYRGSASGGLLQC